MNELEWIEFLRSHVSKPEFGVGIGDDAAVLRDGTLVSIDTFVEGIHFRQDWASWPEIGRKIAVASISDIGAMGGRCTAMLATLSTCEGAKAATGILDGLLLPGIPLVGGDTTSAAKGSTTISLAVLGHACRTVLRSGALPGDRIYVSGELGGSRAGLISLQKGLTQRDLEKRFLNPPDRSAIAVEWGRQASAMIDISDGLVSELYHLSEASRVRIVLDVSAVPIFPGVERIGNDIRAIAMESGDEYELLASSPSPLPEGILIGSVVAGEGVTSTEGRLIARSGYCHSLS